MKFVDMFCGMGTIRMGFEQAGHECVYSVEWDKHKRKIYEVIFGHEPEGCDITTVRAADIPPADCWCFGAPCQDFSVAGLRAGLDGERSGLVREVFRLVGEKEPDDRPEWLLYENVKGMLSSNLGWDFAAIQAEMGELGYDVQWQLLNSKDFGVPQNRERVYTLGHLRARGRREIFPLGSRNTTAVELSRQGVYTNTITARTWGAMSNGTYVVENQREAQVRQIGNVMPTATRENPNQGRVYDPVGLAPCLNKMEGGGREPMIIEPCACLTPDRLEKRQNGRRFKEPNEPMFTLTKQDVHGVLLTSDGIVPADTALTLRSGKHDPHGVDKNHPITGVLIKEATKQDVHGVAILRPVRNEYGKEIRKAYESGEVKESRHKMTQLEPRSDGISNTLSTVQKDNLVLIKEATSTGYAEANVGDSINFSMPNSKTRRGRVGKGVANTLDCACNRGVLVDDDDILEKYEQEVCAELDRQIEESERVIRERGVDYFGGEIGLMYHQRIRRLTPMECFRLQGVPDYITDKLIADGISDSQMYRAAGDACTVNVIYEIARRL